MKLLRRTAPALMLFVLAACPLVAAAQPTDPLSVVTAFNTALNAHDGATALALLADDAVVKTPSGTVYTGKQQIGTYVQGLLAQNYQAHVDSQRMHAVGNLVTSPGKVWLDDWRQLGIAPLDSVAEAIVQDGKIISLSAVLTPESAARLQAAQSRAPAPVQLPRTGEPPASIPLALATGATLLGMGLGLRRRASGRSVDILQARHDTGLGLATAEGRELRPPLRQAQSLSEVGGALTRFSPRSGLVTH